jgi:hypothetical protein
MPAESSVKHRTPFAFLPTPKVSFSDPFGLFSRYRLAQEFPINSLGKLSVG